MENIVSIILRHINLDIDIFFHKISFFKYILTIASKLDINLSNKFFNFARRQNFKLE